MSRIHEALKKAEIEKAAHLPAGERAIMPQVVNDMDVPIFSTHPIAVETVRPPEALRPVRAADGAILMGPAQPDMVRQQVEWIAAGLEAAGRERDDFDITFVTTMSPDVEDVRSWASTQARLLTHYKELPPSLVPFRDEIKRTADSYDYAEHLSTRAEHSAAMSDELTRALAVVGTPDQCVARLRELWSTGVDTLMLPLTGRNRIERWRKTRDEILSQTIV